MRLRCLGGCPGSGRTLQGIDFLCLGGTSCSRTVFCNQRLFRLNCGRQSCGNTMVCSRVYLKRTRVVGKGMGRTCDRLKRTELVNRDGGGSSTLYSMCGKLKLCTSGIRGSCCHSLACFFGKIRTTEHYRCSELCSVLLSGVTNVCCLGGSDAKLGCTLRYCRLKRRQGSPCLVCDNSAGATCVCCLGDSCGATLGCVRRTRFAVIRGSFCSRSGICGLCKCVLRGLGGSSRTLIFFQGTLSLGRRKGVSSIVGSCLNCTRVLVRRRRCSQTIQVLGTKVRLSCRRTGTVCQDSLLGTLSQYCRRSNVLMRTLGCRGLCRLRASDLCGTRGRHTIKRVHTGCSVRQRRGRVGRGHLRLLRGRGGVRLLVTKFVYVFVTTSLLCCLCCEGGGLCLAVIGRGRSTVQHRRRLRGGVSRRFTRVNHRSTLLRRCLASSAGASLPRPRGCTSSSLASRGGRSLFLHLRALL